ncbi:hypothetical protein BDB01DRAFT_852660 [Pilobolus umbonatus]|nr:hypothetical protein BDB01DRAFT_852660 [Pilobolus umbonatus]
MNTLPTEIIEWIVKDLGRKDLYTCLTVNKQYYSIFIKYLYREINIKCAARVTSLLDSLILYPRTKEAGKHVRKFSALKAYIFSKKYKETELVDILMHLPNIEVFNIRLKMDLVRALSDTTKPILTKIKMLDLQPCFRGERDILTNCYHKYRSSLTTLHSVHVSNVLDTLHTIESLTYFAIFPCLDSLEIDLANTMIMDTMVFTDILKVCPSLTNLTYLCTYMNLDRPELIEREEYPLKRLELYIDYITAEDVSYIKNSLPQLKDLSLAIRTGSEDLEGIINAVLQIKSLLDLSFSFFYPVSTKTAARLFHQLFNHYKQKNKLVVNEACIRQHVTSDSSSFSTIYCPEKQLRTILTTLSSPNLFPRMLQVLNQIGKTLDKVSIDCNDKPMKLEDINQRCPVLSKLTLFHPALIPHHIRLRVNTHHIRLRVNTHLTTLVIERCSIRRSIFKEIEVCYPMLKQLHLSWFSISNEEEDDSDEVQYIHLHVTSLKIKQRDPHISLSNMIFIQAVDDVWVKSWYYCANSKKVVISGYKDTLNIIDLSMGIPSYVFVCKDIEDVILES